ncbi:hypothetical protein NDU88_004172 [Pleurodeles waltl]|uniref:Uncharacterized protein n=1 Tax=Pleurodeles waltl TaxID=8319 RepID=A0AAV7RIS0_PLEWA|nr:hypothetical protein NDU88_004172 [Pleurodeles waltl]
MAQTKQKEYFDLSKKVYPHQFEVGDKISIKPPVQRKKGEKRFSESMVIDKVCGCLLDELCVMKKKIVFDHLEGKRIIWYYATSSRLAFDSTLETLRVERTVVRRWLRHRSGLQLY